MKAGSTDRNNVGKATLNTYYNTESFLSFVSNPNIEEVAHEPNKDPHFPHLLEIPCPSFGNKNSSVVRAPDS